MKKLITIVFIFPFFANAQNTFKANIKDKDTKENLVSVTAYIKKLKLGAASDTNGILKISNIPNGEYEIVFSSVGYIVIPPINQPRFRQIYAPLDGRVFNVALRIKL